MDKTYDERLDCRIESARMELKNLYGELHTIKWYSILKRKRINTEIELMWLVLDMEKRIKYERSNINGYE